MKKYEKNTNTIRKMVVLAGIGIVILTVFVSLGSVTSSPSSTETAFVNRSGLTSHDPIYINGNSEFTYENGVSNPGAAGTANDPYIIQNWDINASSAHGIYIKNTDVYFIIRNCVIYDGKISGDGVYGNYGIFFHNVKNGTVDNITSYCNFVGIYMQSLSNNQLINCTVYNNSEGIYLYSASNNQIIKCTAYDNACGIWLDNYSANNQITNSTVYNNSYGISLYYSSNNKIVNYVAYNNGHGLWLYYSSDNQIAKCDVNNSFKNGIYLGSSSNNNITNCTVYNNSDGIFLSSSSNNNISANQIYNNGGGGIFLIGSSNNNIITSNHIYNNGYGIILWDSPSNNWIANSFVYNNSNFGVLFDYQSSRNSITNCTIYNNSYGINLDHSSDNNRITKSTIYNNLYRGINLASSSNNSITNCTVYNNEDGLMFSLCSLNNTITNVAFYNNSKSGIYFDGGSNDNQLINCSFHSNSDYGIWVVSSSHNSITNCAIYNNNNYGVSLYYYSGDNIITNCSIYNNNVYGILVSSFSNNNQIYYNNFINNALQAYDECSNLWDNGTEGNYWSDYTGSDANNDWLGDTAYSVSGGNNYDNYPLMYPYPVGNPSKPKSYSSIQDAIDDADVGDTIYVWDGTYYENIVIDKTISLVGRDRNNTIIDGSGTGDGIYISADWVSIKNLTVKHCWNGIVFISSSDSTVDNCVILDNSGIGLYFWLCSNNSIQNCTIRDNNNCGIYIYYSSNFKVANCNLSNQYCMEIYYSSGNILEENKMWSEFRGLWVWGDQKQDFNNIILPSNSVNGKPVYYFFDLKNTTIQNLDASHVTMAWCNNITLINSNVTSGDGIVLSYTTNSTIANCNIYNTKICGLYLASSNYNAIISTVCTSNFYGIVCTRYSRYNYFVNNTISGSNNCGIYIWNLADYNQFYHNNIINNMLQVDDSCTNFWDNGAEGNYWSDYTGADNDGDGIGDTPYNINGGDNQDNYPLIEPVGTDTINPKITITGVENNTYYNVSVTPVITIFDLNLNATTITLNGENFISGTPITEDGTYVLFVQATDKMNNPSQETITFIIDKIVPTISLISPDNNSVVKPGTVIEFEINDAHLNITTYTLNDGLPETLFSPYNISTEGWEDGVYNITISANDFAGNEISETFMFAVDGTQPTINVTEVMNGSYYNTNVTIFIDISDAHLNEDETIITLDNMSFVSGTEVNAEGKHTLYVYAADTAGNNVSRTIIFTIDKTKPNITTSGVTDGAYYNTDVVPIIDVSDTNINIASITLNGNPFTSGTTVSAENTYVLFVQANDKAGNTANKTIIFIIDKTAPIVTIVESSQTTKEKTFTISWSASESIQYYEVSTDGVNWENVSTNTSHTFTLSKGANTLYVRGTDLAGNKGTADITVTYQEKKGKPGIIPGFEISSFLIVLGICIILLKRKIP